MKVKIFQFHNGSELGMKHKVNDWLDKNDIEIVSTNFHDNHVSAGVHSFTSSTIVIYYNPKS